VSSEIFDALLREKIDIFVASFANVATEVFYDSESGKLRHAGEYGMFREAVVRDFLQFIIPKSLAISTGFLITSMGDVSTQCDVVAFDSKITPLYQEGDRQRFFPVESVSFVGEVKSVLSKTDFTKAINKLSKIKYLSERISHPRVLRRFPAGEFDPVNHPDDLISTILICKKLDFSLDDIENQIDAMYDAAVESRHKHNLILSLEDGLISYRSPDGKSLPYPKLASDDVKNRFTWPDTNKYVHLKLFSSCMFILSANRTLLFPEFSFYMGTIEGGKERNQA
jgi:hypothetical protein